MDSLNREINRAIGDFQNGIVSTLMGTVYGIAIESVAAQFLGPYVPVFLISGVLFLWGILSGAETLANQKHWFVFGVIFISVFLDLDAFALSVGCLVGGFLLRYYLHNR